MGYLFLGGSKDGERICTQERDHIHIRVLNSEIIPICRTENISPNEKSFQRIDYKTEVYKRQLLLGNSGIFVVYALEDKSQNWVLAKLIDGYKRGIPNAKMR
jgi:hypothetical protein